MKIMDSKIIQKRKRKKKKNQFFLFEILKNNIKKLDGKNS